MEYDLALLEHLRANHMPSRETVVGWYAYNLRTSSDEGDVRCIDVVTPLRFIHAEEDPYATAPTVDNVLTIYWTDVKQVDPRSGAMLWGSMTVPLSPPESPTQEHAKFIEAMMTCFRNANGQS